jgi:nickel-dependent lactate racemase
LKIDFPYPGYEQIAAVEVPDANLLDVYSPRSVGEVDEEAVLARGFAEPHGAPRLREAVHRRDRVLILVEDGTRGTPITRLLPYVLEELHAAGVSDDSVTLLTAQGTHREMTEDELRRKLGHFFGRFKAHQHRWLDESNLHDFGKTSDGTCVTANRLLAESDFVLGLGSIVPHRIKGFSGGAKIVFPGEEDAARALLQERALDHDSQNLLRSPFGVERDRLRRAVVAARPRA